MFEMSNEEMKDVYFEFFDLLLEPYCSEAKKALGTYDRTCPSSLSDSIRRGIVWISSENVDWVSVHKSIRDGESTYLKPIKKEATEEQILSYLVYMVVESMGEQRLTKLEILERANKLKELLK
jgi:hypothetical protein